MKLNAGNFKTGPRKDQQYYQINGRFATKNKWLEASKAEVIEIEKTEYIPKEPVKQMFKIATFKERIRGTRVARIVKMAFPLNYSDEEIQQELDSRYDIGFNYVRIVNSIEPGFGFRLYEEKEIEVLGPHSADESP